jgi:dTDP-4-dehydrorhamnose reductase
MRITIFGGTGLLGKAMVRKWTGDEVTALGSKEADIRDAGQVVDAARQSRPEWIVLAAAYTDVDGCELNPERAMAVNCTGAIHVARAAKECGSRLLFISTDYVFDGTKTTPYETSDARNPVSVYGRSKAEAEVALQEIVPECCIARTTWLFGQDAKGFPDAILKQAGEREEISVLNDQRACPTYTDDAADAVLQLCRQQARGIVHVINSGDCTRFDMAREIVAGVGMKTRVVAGSSEGMVRPARRPKYSVLSSGSLKNYGITLPSWQDGVRRYLAAKGYCGNSAFIRVATETVT